MSTRDEMAIVAQAGLLAEEMGLLSDEGLHEAIRLGFRAAGEEWLVRYLAAAREVADRTLDLRPFDEQLLAVALMVKGAVIEMDTGEGKTLVGALAAAAFALQGRHVHVLSVNDYLARRDAQWMRPFYDFVGATVDWNEQQRSPAERKQVYRADVVYASVSEVGFDVLRDRFATTVDALVSPELDVAIVDEADAVLVDEAMVPLVLAAEDTMQSESFAKANEIAAQMRAGDHFEVSADQFTVTLTDAGLDHAEVLAGGTNLFAEENLDLLTRINLALHANVLLQRDVDYVVRDGQIKVVSSSRGRVAELQRWPDGLHNALEEKEGLSASGAGRVLDSLTIQALINDYQHVSGMSGTVLAVSDELREFFELPSALIPRHMPDIRVQIHQPILANLIDKRRAVLSEIQLRHNEGQPLLVGTQSIRESEELARELSDLGIESRVLNARNDADEANVVARAGEYASVTISTQMSGRGTDIRLGGSDGEDRDRVEAAGGLAVIATSHFPSRRLDAQLRGRSGRQGDAGASVQFASLDDELVQANAPKHLLTEIGRRGNRLSEDRRKKILGWAQDVSEGTRLDRHRATWQYTLAIERQRRIVLSRRDEILRGDVAVSLLEERVPDVMSDLRHSRPEAISDFARSLVLYFLDDEWSERLATVNEARDSIHLLALAGQSPSEEFQKLALREFSNILESAYGKAAELASRANTTGFTLDDLGLKRPSATWTYMVRDEPIGSAGDRFAVSLGRSWRRLTRLES